MEYCDDVHVHPVNVLKQKNRFPADWDIDVDDSSYSLYMIRAVRSFLLTTAASLKFIQSFNLKKHVKRVTGWLPRSCLAFYVVNLPSRYYIWTPDHKTVSEVFRAHGQRLWDGQMSFVPPEEADVVFRCRDGQHHRPYSVGDWVEIVCGLYRGDFGIVREVRETDLVKIAVVPRICSDTDTLPDRPAPRLADRDWLERTFHGEEAEDIGLGVFKFRNKLFVDGLLVLTMSALHSVRYARPAIERVLMFSHTNMGILEGIEPFLRRGDTIIIHSGAFQGTAGTVADINDDTVVVEQARIIAQLLQEDSPYGTELRRADVQRLQELASSTGDDGLRSLTVKRSHVRRLIEPGDNVTVKFGPRAGEDGIIINNERGALLLHISEIEPFVCFWTHNLFDSTNF